jgi:hypothetical protein
LTDGGGGVTECEWTVSTVPGSRVAVEITRLRLPRSELCAESFVELRRENATGPLLGRRQCGALGEEHGHRGVEGVGILLLFKIIYLKILKYTKNLKKY